MNISTLVLPLTLLVGCAGPGHDDGPQLPFRVAVLPTTVRALAAHPDAEDAGVTLRLEEVQVRASLLAKLDGLAFTEAVLLELPEDVAIEAFLAQPLWQQDEHWVSEARRAGADLLVETDLAYREGASGTRNDKFWLNLPLFGMGGPACYFVEDRTYVADAILHANVHDLNPVYEGVASLEDGRAQLFETSLRFDGVTMDFLDRAGSNPGSFLVSLLLPAGLLATKGSNVDSQLTRDVMNELGAALVHEVRASASEVLVADDVVPFHLDPDWSWIEEGDELLLVGAVSRMDAADARLAEWRSVAGRESEEEVLGTGQFEHWSVDEDRATPRKSWSRHALRIPVDSRHRGARLRLELLAEGRMTRSRTYTFVVPD